MQTARASRRFLLAAAVVAISLGTAAANAALSMADSPEDVGLSAERLQRITEVVRRHIEAGDVAGVVTVVARRGQVAHFEAQGHMDLASQARMPNDAIFRLASMSKPITAVAIMMLVEEGRIRLSDPVARFIPEFERASEVAMPRADGADEGFDLVTAVRPITIHDLLTHRSGLVSGGLGAGVADEIAPRGPRDTLASHIPRLAEVPLDFQPGTLWRYSGSAGFNVLSRVVEVVSGMSFDRFLEERIFAPLGMTDTAFYFTGARAARLATMYQTMPNGLEPVEREMSSVYFSGAGGLASTAADYLKFAQMLLNGGELTGQRLLGPRTVELMIANHTGDMVNGQFGRPDRGMGFGLSMQVVLDPVAAGLSVSEGAYGWAGGTGVSFWIEPEEDMVSIFMIQGGSGGELRRGFENAVRQAIID